MKIIKVLGVVAGIHVFALMLIFANPGCSSTTKPTPAPVDTIARAEPGPAITVPGLQPAAASGASGMSAAPISFNPDAPALAGDGIRFTPTRPGTAAASTLVATPVADVTPMTTYTVKSGDNLWTIAKKNNLTAAELAASNNLKTSVVLHEGQKLLISSKHTSPAASASSTAMAPTAATKTEPAPKPSAESTKYTVKPGDTLGTIAKNFGVRSKDISTINNISDPQKLRAGTVLTIPGYKAVTDKTTTATGKTSATGTTAKPSVSPTDAAPIFGAPSANQVPVIGPSSTSPDIPIIKLDDPSAASKKP
jgi:LysM repeat protein